MRIHLILPTYGGDQGVFASELLLEAKHPSILLSFAYKNNEKTHVNLWNGLINHVESTRNS